MEVAGVRLTHPDRVLYPEQGVTKERLARYVEEHASRLLPHVEERPLSVVRCPKGRTGHCFYQKHVSEGLPDGIRGVEIREKSGKATYLMVSDTRGLVGLVQVGVLEIHPWGCRRDRLERPDRLVLDLDPGPGADFDLVTQGALRLRERLEELDLESFVRTTGGKGLHVVVPLVRRSSWDEVKDFARGLAEEIADGEPRHYVATASKSEREGRVYVDWLRNARGATAIASYSMRALEGAPVATPLRWDELGSLESGSAFDVESIGRRLSSLRADPWKGFFEVRQSLTAAARREVGS